MLAGTNITGIANSLVVSRQAVHQTITGLNASPRIRAAIAKAINKPVSEIWPDSKPEEQAA